MPFRTLNREAGCKFAFLEMLCARSLSYLSKRTREMMFSNDNDRPLGVQLLGNDLYYLLKALEKLKDYNYDLLDFNAACPQKKVTGRGKGAALLKCPKKLQKLLAGIIKEARVPVTAKLRLGWDDAKKAVSIAKYVQDAGVTAICIHGRTKIQGFRDSVNYSAIRKIKAALSIPIIGSGDIWSAHLAKKMFEETGCDAIVAARGALGNPWIFNEIDELLTTGKTPARPTVKEAARMMKYHLDLCLDFYGEKTGTIKFRKFYIWYTRGYLKTKLLRTSVSRANNKFQMYNLIDKFVTTVKLTAIRVK